MKTFVWSLPTRISHFLVFLALVIAYLLGGEEDFINAHASLGYLAGILILFRIIWGLAGPLYSRFSDFPMGFKEVLEFLTDMKSSKLKYPGHNPVASWVMVAMMINVVLVVLSGMANLAAEGQGPIAFIGLTGENEFFEEAHEVLVNILIGLVLVHFMGIAVDTIFHRRTGTLASMITGYKNLTGENVKLNAFQKVFSIVWIVGALTLFTATFTSQNLKISDAETETEGSDSQISDDEDEEND